MKANKIFFMVAVLSLSCSNGQVPANDEPGQLFEERLEGVTYYKSGARFSWEQSLNMCKVVFGDDSTLLNVNTNETLSRIYELLSRENGEEIISKRFWTDGAYDRGIQKWRWNNGTGDEFGEFIEWEGTSQFADENSRALIIINGESDRPIRFAFANKDIQYHYVCDTPKLLACS